MEIVINGILCKLRNMSTKRAEFFITTTALFANIEGNNWLDFALKWQTRIFAETKKEISIDDLANYLAGMYDNLILSVWQFLPENLQYKIKHPKNLKIEDDEIKKFVVWANQQIVEYSNLIKNIPASSETLPIDVIESILCKGYKWGIDEVRDLGQKDMYMALHNLSYLSDSESFNSMIGNATAFAYAQGNKSAKKVMDRTKQNLAARQRTNVDYKAEEAKLEDFKQFYYSIKDELRAENVK